MSGILSSNNNSVSVNSRLISFKDCPFNCVDGKIVDPFQHKRKPCPYCSKKREEFSKGDMIDGVSGKTLAELLDLPVSYTGNEFSEDIVVPEFARKNITPESLNMVLQKLREMVTDISIGTLPKYSILFNLGKKSNEVNFIYPYLIKGYISGRTLVPLINASDICVLRQIHEGSLPSSAYDKDIKFNDLVTSDICVIVIDAGATFTSIGAVKGLMQLRAQKMKPTVIFTNIWVSQIRDMCSEGDYESYNLARLFSVEYVNDDKESKSISQDEILANQTKLNPQSNGIGVSRDIFESMMRGKNSL